MSGNLFDRYGAIVNEDVEVLEACLARLTEGRQSTVRVLEIGCHDGGTALGIKLFLAARRCRLEYWGIDPDASNRIKFNWGDGCTVIEGDSAEVFEQIPENLDLVWIDGCHCFNHVALDTLHYAPKVRDGGFLCFHDTNYRGQGQFHQYHGPADSPYFGLSVNHALYALGFPWPGWMAFEDRAPADRADCGTRSFWKMGLK